MTDRANTVADPNGSIERFPQPAWWLGLLGLLLVLAGAALAFSIRTANGTSVRDIRFAGASGETMSALLYVPPGVSAAAPAPGILAVHGYLNSRESQDGFAIEFARRGYVVLSLDQTGHGYSGGAALTNGFGGPDGLRYLRSLPMVDTRQIGLEGHSMGGWAVLAAAAAMPDAYRSIVLVGSSTGAPFAKEGSSAWPRNLALVFSRYDEFSGFMWDTRRAIDVTLSPKLQKLFKTRDPVVAKRVYGPIASGTARVLFQPATTHPGEHISPEAIRHATDWFVVTLNGGRPRPSADQIWYWKEVGTGMGLVGFVLVLLGAFDALVRMPAFATLQREPVPGGDLRDSRWWTWFALNAAIPALLFLPVFIGAGLLLPPSTLLPQAVTTQVTAWALASAGLVLLMRRLARTPEARAQPPWLATIGIALATVAVGYAVLWLVDQVFGTDFRLWVVAVKLPSARQWAIAALYVVPLILAFLATLRPLCHGMTVRGDRPLVRYGAAALALSLGFVVMLGAIYAILFATGRLVTGFDPLSTVIAIQFVPVLVAVAVVAIFTWQRTSSHRPGALIAGLLVTLYVVAGTATQV